MLYWLILKLDFFWLICRLLRVQFSTKTSKFRKSLPIHLFLRVSAECVVKSLFGKRNCAEYFDKIARKVIFADTRTLYTTFSPYTHRLFSELALISSLAIVFTSPVAKDRNYIASVEIQQKSESYLLSFTQKTHKKNQK